MRPSMRLRLHLFFKTIFFRLLASFFLVMILTGVAGIIITSAFQQLSIKRLHTDISRQRENGFSRIAILAGQTGMQLFHYGGEEEFQAYRDRLHTATGMDIYLLQPDGSLISGRALPFDMQEYVERVAKTGDLIERLGEEVLIVKTLRTGRNTEFIVVALQKNHPQPPGPGLNLPPPPLRPDGEFFPELGMIGFPFFPFHNVWDILRGIVLFCIVAGICFFLARSLTKPIKKMQRISRQIAQGDYSARIGAEILHSGRELEELGHDFDDMAEKTEKVIQAQKRLLRDISHELRSPLARLGVALEIVRKESTGAAIIPLERIERESNRINDLIGELLQLTRLDLGESSAALEAVDLIDLLQKIVEDVFFEFRSRSIDIQLDGPSACVISGKYRLLHRAFENILRNGAKYTAAESMVKLLLHDHGDSVEIVVSDCGPGIPEEELSRIFDPFYRVSQARERHSGGVGLGLAIARQAICLHGGTIEAQNRKERAGLLVRIVLPPAGRDISAS